MDTSIVLTALGAASSLLGTATTYLVARVAHRRSRERVVSTANAETYRRRMERLSGELAKASALVDLTLTEMAEVTKAREAAMRTLENRLNELTENEKELKTRVDTLRNVPLPAVEYFLQATEKSEKRSAVRDYLLFGAGVVVSTIVTIMLKLFFGI